METNLAWMALDWQLGMKSNYIHFKDIDVDCPDTWQNKRILSFDMDWASDEVLADSIDLVERSGVKACFFVTHDTILLKRLRENEKIELGLHPNFNPLILAQSLDKSADNILEELKEIVPEASVLRSHSMTTSGRWLDLYKQHGIQYVSNYIMFLSRQIFPFRQINGLIEAPVYYADDGHLVLARNEDWRESLLQFDVMNTLGLQIFNFHPIHVFLNAQDINCYRRTRHIHDNYEKLIKYRAQGMGTRSRLLGLLKTAELSIRY